MSENLESVTRRIQKLLAIAGDDRANPEEASAAAGMAERIMRKYQLEHIDIVMASLKAGDDLESVDCVASAKTNGTKCVKLPTWANWLAVAVSRLNDCGAVINQRESGVVVTFHGFAGDVRVCEWTYNYLVATTNRLCKEFRQTAAFIIGGRPEMNSYRQGVSVGMLKVINNMIAAKVEEVKATPVTSNALVVAKKEAILAKFGAGFGTKKSKSSVSHNTSSFSQGVRDGKAVDVNRRAVSGPSDSGTLRLGN